MARRFFAQEGIIRQVDDIAQYDQDGAVIQQAAALVHGVTDPERLALYDVPGLKLVTLIDKAADGVSRWGDDQYDLADTQTSNLFEDVLEHRLPRDGNQGLGGSWRDRAQPASAARNGDDGLHGTPLRVYALSRRHGPGPK